MDLMTRLRGMMNENEGRSKYVYNCPAGFPTVGVGFNLERGDASRLLSSVGADYIEVFNGEACLNDAQIDLLLDICIRQSIVEASALVKGWTTLPTAAQIVLIDMVFNMGAPKVMKFPKLLRAIEEEDWELAAKELRESRYYRQTGNRARRNEEMLLNLVEDR